MNEFFHFSLFERRGIGTLLVCLVLLTWLPRYWSSSGNYPEKVTWEEIPAKPPVPVKRKSPIPSRQKGSVQLRRFDPNTVTYEALTEMGLPTGLAKGLVNYRGAGAHFRYREDLLKLYQMDSVLFARMESFIDLPGRPAVAENPPSQTYQRNYEKRSVTVFINRATPAEWAELRGIGPVLSSRIVAFRDKLGGFSATDQVSETYGLPDSTFRQIREHLRLEQLPARLLVNQFPAEQLAGHPYISWKQARAITSFRTNHGPFASLADFQVLHIFTREEHRRLEPYLDFTTRPGKGSDRSGSPATVQ